MKSLSMTLIGLALAVPTVCLAQWQWIDKDGRKVFSDQSPPADIPAKNILKQPKGAALPAPEPVAAAASAPASAPQAAVPVPKVATGKDKQLEDKKKQAEAADAEKKKAQEEELAKVKAENCARAKSAKASFDSGIRIARTNEKGEREFLDDAQRAAETKRMERVIASDCKPAG
jgi:hypothetical protein